MTSHSTIDRPPVQPPSTGPEQPSNDPNKKKSRKGLLIGGIAGTALAAVLAGGIFAVNQRGEGQPGSEGDGEGSEPGTEQVDNPTAGEYMVDLEELSQMSPEQITELATITVESVTGPDGNIDWELYAKKLNDIMLLGTVAGTTTAEVEEIYLNATTGDVSRFDPLVNKYDPAFIEGFAVPGLGLGGYKQTHLSFLGAAEGGYLINMGPVIRTLDLISVDVAPEANNEQASFTMIQHTTDNFFSSGIFDAANPKDVADLGRSTDANLTYQSEATAVVIDGNIYLEYINP